MKVRRMATACRLLLSLTIFSVSQAGVAQSAQAGDQLAAITAACTADAQKLCAGVPSGGGRIVACLKQHKDQLSDSCRQAAGLPPNQASAPKASAPSAPATPSSSAAGSVSSPANPPANKAQATPVGPASSSAASMKTLKGSSGGTIVYGPVPGQQTYQTVLSVMLKRVESDYSDRPQMGSMLQSRNANFWEGFFTFANKKQTGNTPMTGAVIIYAPQSGTSGGATLIDTTANFPKSANSMLQTLVQTIQSGAQSAQNTPQNTPRTGGSAPATASGPAAASAAASGPPQQLVPYVFPDKTAAISLPANWKPTDAKMGDVKASGPNGESLRFGFVIEALDPNLPSSRTLGGGRSGSFVLLPFNEDPAKMYQDALNQLSQKQRLPTITFTAKTVNDQHAPQGKNVIMQGTETTSNGLPPVEVIIQLLVSPENQMGFEIKIFQISAPDAVFKQELPTLNAIFPTYTGNEKLISQIATANTKVVMQAANNTIAFEQNLEDSSDRMTQGMSDFLRGQSVLVDNSTGQHYRGPDDLASALQNADPNRFQTLSPGQYLSGVDY